MRLISGSQIWQCYSMVEAIKDVAAAFAATSRGEMHLPLRTRINLDEQRTLLFMPAAGKNPNRDAVVKTIALYPGNACRDLPTAPATIQLVDRDTGQPKALLDGDTVTRIRTGASSGVAYQLLASSSAKIGAVVGTGSQAYTQVLALIAALPELAEIRIVNPRPGAAETFINKITAWTPYQNTTFATTGQLTAYTQTAAALPEADAVTLVTASHQPVLSASDLKPGCVVSCVGSYQPQMQECGCDVIRRADRIICDQVEAALAESGDLIVPLREGIITRGQVDTEIGEIINGVKPGRQSPAEIIVYETVGVGAQDLYCAQAITAAAEKAQLGWEWDPNC